MHVSLSNKTFILLCFILVVTPLSAYSDSPGVTVKHAETFVSNENYLLSADLTYQLSDKASEALRNGVPLFWVYQYKVDEKRPFLWNKSLIEKNIRYRIQYHALLNMFRVRNESNGEVDNFSTLEAALDLLSTIRNFPLIEKTKIADNSTYLVGIKISFERDALPLPLRPMAYMNPQWYLSSDWYVWPLKK